MSGGKTAVATPRARRRLRSSVIAPVAAFAVFIGWWYLYATTLSRPSRRFLVPLPHEVVDVVFLRSFNRRELLDATLVSAKVSLIGLAFAVAIGVVVGVLMAQGRWLEMAIFPYAVMLQVTPILAIVPLIGLTYGFDFRSRVIVCTIIALFPIITNTLFGMKAASAGLHDLLTLQQASRWQRLVKLQLPAAMPAVFTGFRISAGLSVIGAIVGDFFFGQGEAGLGIRLKQYQSTVETEKLYGAVIACVLLGLVVFTAFGRLNKAVVGSWADQ